MALFEMRHEKKRGDVIGISACPAALVAAPVEDVWELLSQPARYDDWSDAHLERAIPEGPVVEGLLTPRMAGLAHGAPWSKAV
jgi:hypothetical protein